MKRNDNKKEINVLQMHVKNVNGVNIYSFTPYKEEKPGKVKKVLKKIFSKDNITTFATILAIVQALYKIVVQIMSWLN